MLSRLAAPVRAVRRRPRLAVGVLILLAVCAVAGVRGYVEWHLRSAAAAADRWHNRDAVAHLSAALRVSADNPRGLLLAARVARRTGRAAEGKALLDRYAERHGEDERLGFEVLLHRAASGELDSSVRPLVARADAGGPDGRLAREALAVGLMARFRWPQAAQLLDRWVAADPTDPLPKLFQGRLAEEQGAREHAARLYREVLAADPELADARLRLTSMLVERRLGDEALAELAVLQPQLPDHQQVRLLAARALALVGRADEARAAVEQCLAADPDDPNALVEKGNYLMLDGDYPAAALHFGRAVRADPGHLVAVDRYATALARSGRPAEAEQTRKRRDELEADLERVMAIIRGPLQARPSDPDLHFEIAQIYLRGGQLNTALAWLDSALSADPRHARTLRTLTGIHAELGNPLLAARYRAVLQQIDPDH